MRRTKHSLLS